MAEVKYECLECGLVLDEYSRPHFPAPTPGDERRLRLQILGSWSNYEDMPRSLRPKEVCWGTVVSTFKYNKPVKDA